MFLSVIPGVHFSFLLSFREWSTNVKLLSLTCVLSLVAFGVKTCGRKSSDVNDTVSGIPSGYFMLGLLGEVLTKKMCGWEGGWMCCLHML